MGSHYQHLDSMKYVNDFVTRHESRARIQRTRSFLGSVKTFVLGMAAVAVGFYATEHFETWSPYVQRWVNQLF